MNHSSAKVLRSLTGNEDIEAISIDALQKLIDENPYFPLGHFYLAKKLKVDNNPGFLPQAQKTALYFSNPLWLHYQLEIESSGNGLPDDNNFITATEDAQLPAVKKQAETAESHLTRIITYSEEKKDQPEEEMASITRAPDVETEEFLNEAADTEGTFVHDNIKHVEFATQPSAGLEATEVLEEMGGVSQQTDETAEEFLNGVSGSSEEIVEKSFPEAEAPPLASDVVKENKNDESTERDEHEIMFQNIKAMLDATSEEADADIKNAVIPIDPYYTIDYFASQGIKLELDQNPKDELGRHLKKFTQWLKHMKKLGPEDAAEVIARTETEVDIQKIADKSNTAREVVTEAMASVLEKQGKKDKAIELYNKLSFLNPDKSAYFAGKIKNLKGN